MVVAGAASVCAKPNVAAADIGQRVPIDGQHLADALTHRARKEIGAMQHVPGHRAA